MAPPSAQCSTWWASHRRDVQPGKRHLVSRAAKARRIDGGIVRVLRVHAEHRAVGVVMHVHQRRVAREALRRFHRNVHGAVIHFERAVEGVGCGGAHAHGHGCGRGHGPRRTRPCGPPTRSCSRATPPDSGRPRCRHRSRPPRPTRPATRAHRRDAGPASVPRPSHRRSARARPHETAGRPRPRARAAPRRRPRA